MYKSNAPEEDLSLWNYSLLTSWNSSSDSIALPVIIKKHMNLKQDWQLATWQREYEVSVVLIQVSMRSLWLDGVDALNSTEEYGGNALVNTEGKQSGMLSRLQCIMVIACIVHFV